MVNKKKAAIVFFAGILSGAAGLLAGDRVPPFERQSGHIDPNVVGYSDTATVRWTDAHYNRHCQGIIYRFIEDSAGNLHPLPATPITFTQTPPNTEVFQFMVPRLAACGPARYHSDLTFVCETFFGRPNPFQRLWPINVRSPNVPFEISCGNGNGNGNPTGD